MYLYLCFRAKQNVAAAVCIVINEDTSSTSDVTVNDYILGDEPLKMCNFTTQYLIDCFVYSRETNGIQCEDWKSLNAGGFKLFAEDHVQDIYICTCDDDCKLKAVCLPEMKKDHLYYCWHHLM